MNFLLQWLLSALAIIIISYILPGVQVSGLFAALMTALVLGLINTFIRPILTALTLPLNAITLGISTFVLNALLVLLASAVVPGFTIVNFWWALLFSLILSLFSYLLHQMGGGENRLMGQGSRMGSSRV